MFRSMASAFAAFVGSITAPLASLNQLAMSTAIVKFFVSLASVTGGLNVAAISASTSDVKVKSCVALLASVKTPVTLTLIPLNSGWAVRNGLVIVRFHRVGLRLHAIVGPSGHGHILQHHLGGGVHGQVHERRTQPQLGT